MLAEGVYKRRHQWAPRNSTFWHCQITKLLSGKGKSCLWLLTCTEMGKPFHPNNLLSLTDSFSPRSLKRHPTIHHSHLSVPEIQGLQAHQTGVKTEARQGEVTSPSAWADRGEGTKCYHQQHAGNFHWAPQWTHQTNMMSTDHWKSLKCLWWREKLHSSTAWEHHWRIQGTED